MSDTPPRTGDEALLDPSQPSAARRYQHWLGGKDCFLADIASANELAEQVPAIPAAAQESRKFLLRAVRYLAAERAIQQFLDLGCGLPYPPDVDDVACAVTEGSRVLYVDHDVMVGVHRRALSGRPPRIDFLAGDLRDPAAVLTSPEVAATLDLRQPVAVLMCAVLHLIGDRDDPAGLIRHYASKLAPGSHLVISHGTLDALPDAHRAVLAGREHLPDAYCPRSRDQLARLFDGWDLLEPGIVPTVRWHPALDPAASHTLSDADAMCYAAVAVRR